MSSSATALTSWARAIQRALDKADCDSDALFRAAGLDPAALADPNARYPLENTTRLWRLAVRATGDEAFGLTVASQVTPTTFHALGYALVASPTLKDAFERILRYFRIITDAAELEFQRVGETYEFRIQVPERGPQPADEAIDAFVAVHIRTCRALSGRRFSPLRVELRRPPPADVASFEAVLRAPLVFGAAGNRLIFDRKSFEAPLPGANPELARLNEEIARRYLARFDKGNVIARLETALIETLPHGEPSQKQIATALNLSARSLQRRLAEAGTSYRERLDATRRDLALSYIADSSYSVSEITYLLGYSDTSSFNRAFRRWTGTAPSRYRGSAPNG